MESIERKIKEEDRYVLLYDESLNQQLKKKPAGHRSYTRIKLNLNRKLITSILMVVQVTLA
jgi:hypothetical protein